MKKYLITVSPKFQYTTYRLLSENQNLLFLDVILAIVTRFFYFFCIFFFGITFKVNFFRQTERDTNHLIF